MVTHSEHNRQAAVESTLNLTRPKKGQLDYNEGHTSTNPRDYFHTRSSVSG